MQTAVRLPFADGKFRFDLGTSEMRELERRCGLGFAGIWGRVMREHALLDGGPPLDTDMAFVIYVVETIRLGLIGGGGGEVAGRFVSVSPESARQLIDRYVKPRSLVEAWSIAATVLNAKMMGISHADQAKLLETDPPAKPRRSRTKKADAESASLATAQAA